MKRIHFIFFVLLFAFSCTKKTNTARVDEPKVIEDTPIPEEEIVEVNTVDEDEGEEPVYLLCELQRTPCYGKCPSFNIKLYSDGKVTYHGTANVDKIGHYVAFCEPQYFDAIFTAAEQANFFVLRNQYPEDGRKLNDLPNTITYLKRNGLEKRVIDNFDAPGDLINFEKWLDQFFDGLEWQEEKR